MTFNKYIRKFNSIRIESNEVIMTIKQSIQIMKALADTSRLMILNVLIEKPHYVEEMSQILNLAPSTVSFHLKKLEQADLVIKEKQQYYVIYKINKSIFNLSLQNLISFENYEKLMQQERIDKYKEKVLETFYKNGKLIKLPAQYKKRLIVIEKIYHAFEKDKKYTEKQINETIGHYFEDYCTVRRYFIDLGLMKREKDIYWLTDKSFDYEKLTFGI